MLKRIAQNAAAVYAELENMIAAQDPTLSASCRKGSARAKRSKRS
jgi:hypothetical protein